MLSSFTLEDWVWLLTVLVTAIPAVGLFALTAVVFGSSDKHEQSTRTIVQVSAISEILCSILLLYTSFQLARFGRQIPSVSLPFLSVESSMTLLADALALPFVVMTSFLSGLVALFALNYLRWEPGYLRFFLLYLMFVLGMQMIFLGGSFEAIFVGWEIIGLTSALLISFFFTSPQTVDNAQRAFWAYRLTDIGLFLGAILLSHSGHEGEFSPVEFLAHSVSEPLSLTGWAAYIAPLLILLPALGKSAQIPFSQWLPRAMEGPTPSSAIFYGALSVHAGVFLCLRLFEEVQVPFALSIFLLFIGSLTACYATLVGNIQADIKGRLAYASMAQVGLMMTEISLGFRWLVVLHFIGHSTLRTYQLLYAMSWVHEHQEIWRPLKVLPLQSRYSQSRWFTLAFHLSLSDGWARYQPVDVLEKLSSRLRSNEAKLRKALTGVKK